MDTLVFDIETSNFFTDPDVGWDNFGALKISVLGVYSYLQDKYFVFDEGELERAVELFGRARKLVGFSMNRYDAPVLDFYFKRMNLPSVPDIWEKERVDLLEEIEAKTGHRVSLSRLAQENLGVKKDRHGSEAIDLYRDGRIDELKEYCLNDVRLTKELYDIFRKKGEFLVPDRNTGEIKKVKFERQYAALF